MRGERRFHASTWTSAPRGDEQQPPELSMPTAKINGCDIYYETNGNGPDVVFIHGEDHGIEMFEHQVAHLSGQYRCVAYYRRGHGRSELPPYGYSLRNQMLDLAGLLDHLEIQHAAIVAVAMATTIAASY